MPDCSRIDALVTPYVDGELPQPEQTEVSHHLSACPLCRTKVAAEQAVRALIRTRREDLAHPAPPDLKSRCAALCAPRPAPVLPFPTSASSPQAVSRRAWPVRLARGLGVAAAVLLAVGALIYQGTMRSNRVLAAELAADHEKCFGLNQLLGTHDSADTVEAAMASGFDWHMRLPDVSTRKDISLIGSRPCLYGEGKTAHIMFTHNGEPVSLFMLARGDRSDQVVNVLGHQCRIWSQGNRTFVLVARSDGAPLEDMATLVRATLEKRE